jgi:hypothetical protein
MHILADNLIESIHSSGFNAAIVVTGGGSGAVHALLSHPGASRFVLEAQIPYCPEAMFDYLGERLDSFCSSQSATTMAERAFERALIFSLSNKTKTPFLGMACTAALQTTRERRGDDRAFVCIKTRKEEVVRELKVPAGSRLEQEAAISEGVLTFLLEFLENNHA